MIRETSCMASHYSYTADSPVGEDEFFAQACLSIGGKRRVSQQNGERRPPASMNCYPSGEYESYIQAMLPACGELQDDGSVETIDEQSEQDGAVVISTTTTYNDHAGLLLYDPLLCRPRDGRASCQVRDGLQQG